MINNLTIAKNTLFLYFRMFLILLITLYTSRVILQILGVTDYGIYQVVGGVVGILTMLNSALSIGTSRFLTYELGRDDSEKLNKAFCTTLISHVILALIICFLAETIGLWFVYNKLSIPYERMGAAVFAYHISVLTVFFLLTQAPYTAIIIAHEKMKIYAYVSIVEVTLKLAIVYLLAYCELDKLKLYVILICIVQISLLFFYRFYCIKKIKESKFKLVWDMSIFKPIFNFSSCNLLMEGSKALNNQGFVVLTNMFFGPTIVAARAIALQVNSAANQFINNFRLASNPQIVKLQASGNINESHTLVLQSARYTFYLMLLLALPIILGADRLLMLWLGQVPIYAVPFLQLAVIQGLFTTFDLSFDIALHAQGRLKEEAVVIPIIALLCFIVVYVLFRYGFSPLSLSYVAIVQYAMQGFLIKPILIHKISNYSYRDIFLVFLSCIKVTIMAVVAPILFNFFMPHTYLMFFITTFISLISVCLSVYFLGIDFEMKCKIKNFILNKICKKSR